MFTYFTCKVKTIIIKIKIKIILTEFLFIFNDFVYRCAYDILKRRDKKKKRLCPDCHKSVSSRLYLHCDDTHDLNQSSLSLASLKASSLATLNDCHATSSV